MIQFRISARLAAPMAVAIAVLVGVSSASAQATISGAVRDPSGAVLPGVTVEASSDALIETSCSRPAPPVRCRPTTTRRI